MGRKSAVFFVSVILAGIFVFMPVSHAADPSGEEARKGLSTATLGDAQAQGAESALPLDTREDELKAPVVQKSKAQEEEQDSIDGTDGDDEDSAAKSPAARKDLSRDSRRSAEEKGRRQNESREGKEAKEEGREDGKDGKDGKEGKEERLRTERESLSPLEKLITSDDILKAGKLKEKNPARTLVQFGYNYFRKTSFSPQTDVPVSPDYLVGPGDSLILNIWGSVEGAYQLVVSRSGEVVLPRCGPVRVAGVPFGKLREVFRIRLAREFRDFDLSVNMGRLRSIKVFVVGEVKNPGDYSLSSLSTLLNALGSAGGPTKNGSLRNIKLRRAGGGEETVDLYQFFTRGDKSRDVRLNSGDTIFVPVIGKVAAIAGNVKRPAIYELKDEKSLRDLLSLAEGVTATGYLQQVQISRVVANRKKEVLDLNLDTASTGKPLDRLAEAIPIQDLDIVRIFPINNLLRDHFRLEGHVDRPGFYGLRPGLRLSDVVTREHLLPEYHPNFLEVTRLVPPDLAPQKILVNLNDVLDRVPGLDLEVKEFDLIRVFSRKELEKIPMVKISGEVQKPGSYRLFKGMTVRDLLIQGGNLTPSAFVGRAELSRLEIANDKVYSFPLYIDLGKALRGDPKANIALEPFDELSVKKIPNWSEETERYITLSGEVRFPGRYPIYKGERLASVLERAGGFTEKAYLPGAKFTRESLQELQQKRLDEALLRLEEEVTKKETEHATVAASAEEANATKAALEGLKSSISLLKTKKAEGRLLISIKSLDDLRKGHANLELKGGDTLSVPSNPDAVNVLGEVYNSTSVVYESGRNVGYYLDKVGGTTSNADSGEIYVVKMDGTVVSRKQTHTFLFFNSFDSKPVSSGDTIVVPQSFERIAWMREIKDLTTIVSQIALTAGVILAAGL